MARSAFLSIIFVFILSMYQINQTLTFSLSYPKYIPLSNDRYKFIHEYFRQMNQKQVSPLNNFLESDNTQTMPRINWFKRDLHISPRMNRRMLCFFNTVTCFG
ncbi:hypothetical protein I4U23_001916 [Adineta vaga]|nr:hypothetical protein I4U23_001916 [Adineta vaga]